jgi:class 3 adenylate cyclase
MSQTRRLAAILAADVAGYSRLMGVDEEGTLERLKALRHELIDPTIAEHRGRIVKTTGDGLLVEFASVVDAVRCAVAVQQAMPERDTDLGAGNRIELRIGINRRRDRRGRRPLRRRRQHRGPDRGPRRCRRGVRLQHRPALRVPRRMKDLALFEHND